jgi:hypothetical protein
MASMYQRRHRQRQHFLLCTQASGEWIQMEPVMLLGLLLSGVFCNTSLYRIAPSSDAGSA